MKFSYDNNNMNREPKAYIDQCGDLVLRDGYFIDCQDGSIEGQGCYGFNPKDATKVFYEGDSVTLTF